MREGTKVVLTHTGWERFGDHAAQERDGYNEGWEAVFAVSYVDYVRHTA
ncbi:MAG: hypothetical protein HYS05_20820 [Acidobacteria bacterium]|nr:hypothetical protein [Acidobacteriota bacterium]